MRVETALFDGGLRNIIRPEQTVFMKYATSCKEVLLKPVDLEQKRDSIEDERKRLKMPVVFEDDRPGMEGQLNRKYYYPVIFDGK